MFRLKCNHCGQEILISEHCEKFPMICAECGGCLVIVEDLRKEERPVIIPYTPPAEPHPDVFPYVKEYESVWIWLDNTTTYYNGTNYSGTYTVNSSTGKNGNGVTMSCCTGDLAYACE